MSTLRHLAETGKHLNAAIVTLDFYPDTILEIVAAVQAGALPRLYRLKLSTQVIIAEAMSALVAAFTGFDWPQLQTLKLCVRDLDDAAIAILVGALGDGTGFCSQIKELEIQTRYERMAAVNRALQGRVRPGLKVKVV